ncbi:MAG: hypothetical protein ACRD2W_10660 [Acidimicrobiales bacterium]
MRTRVGAVALVAVVAGALAACGDDGTVVGSAPSRPQGKDEVVVQVLIAGGFVPVDVALGAVPSVTVLGDGTVISQAPVTAIYPGPAMPPLQAVTVPASTVDGLIRTAQEQGLLGGDLDFGRPPVADAPDTTVTIVAGGTTHRHSANALGITDDVAGPGLSAQQVKNRRALQAFVEATSALPPGERAWEPAEVAVYVVGAYTPDPQLPQPPQAWPLAAAPAATGIRSCTLVSGGDVTTLLGALRKANARTPWVINGVQQSLAFRPVVPGQPGCST